MVSNNSKKRMTEGNSSKDMQALRLQLQQQSQKWQSKSFIMSPLLFLFFLISTSYYNPKPSFGA